MLAAKDSVREYYIDYDEIFGVGRGGWAGSITNKDPPQKGNKDVDDDGGGDVDADDDQIYSSDSYGCCNFSEM